MGDQAAGDVWRSFAKQCMNQMVNNYRNGNKNMQGWFFPTADVKVFVRLVAGQPQAWIYTGGGIVCTYPDIFGPMAASPYTFNAKDRVFYNTGNINAPSRMTTSPDPANGKPGFFVGRAAIETHDTRYDYRLVDSYSWLSSDGKSTVSFDPLLGVVKEGKRSTPFGNNIVSNTLSCSLYRRAIILGVDTTYIDYLLMAVSDMSFVRPYDVGTMKLWVYSFIVEPDPDGVYAALGQFPVTYAGRVLIDEQIDVIGAFMAATFMSDGLTLLLNNRSTVSTYPIITTNRLIKITMTPDISGYTSEVLYTEDNSGTPVFRVGKMIPGRAEMYLNVTLADRQVLVNSNLVELAGQSVFDTGYTVKACDYLFADMEGGRDIIVYMIKNSVYAEGALVSSKRRYLISLNGVVTDLEDLAYTPDSRANGFDATNSSIYAYDVYNPAYCYDRSTLILCVRELTLILDVIKSTSTKLVYRKYPYRVDRRYHELGGDEAILFEYCPLGLAKRP